MSCIDVNHLSKSYDSVNVVDDLVLSIKSGQVFGFLGPNGAGKSTTIKLLTTLIPASSGTISILGEDAVTNPMKIRHKIGVVLQQPSYEPTLSVEKSLEKYGMMWDISKTERKKRMEQLLIDFDLTAIRKKRNEDLSIGQRRRVQVAREFMHDMELLFLDEPTVGLDPSARRKRFGKKKTIKIHLLEKQLEISSLLSGIPDCKIDFETGTNIIIHSEQSELVLLKILKLLNDTGIEIEDLSAVPTNLEEIFLNMMRENASDN